MTTPSVVPIYAVDRKHQLPDPLVGFPLSSSFKKTHPSPSGFIALPENGKNISEKRPLADLELYRTKGRLAARSMDAAHNERRADTGPPTVNEYDWNVVDYGKVNRLQDMSRKALEHLDLGYLEEFFKGKDACYRSNRNIHYDNQYCAYGHAIIAKGIFRKDEHTGDIARTHWSDVTFPIWKEYCEGDGIAPGDLEYIIEDTVINKDTTDIINQIIPASQRRHLDFSKVFTRDNPDFYALLATPNAIGSAYICINYATSMRYKRVASITPFYNTQAAAWSMIIKFEH